MLKLPKTFFLLACLQMWRFFSHYGTRAILILYMVDQLRMSDSRAFGTSALFCGIVELGGIFGGILADRILGLRRAVLLGAPIMAAGYLGLIFEGWLFAALALIVLGGSLFCSNITALAGECFAEDDPRRERGFTLFYMMQNLGALVAILVCGIVAKEFGYRIGFAVAGSGMVVGSIMLCTLPKRLVQEPLLGRGKISLFIPLGLIALGGVALVIFSEKMILPLLPWMSAAFFIFFAVKLWRDPELPKEKVRLLLIYLGGLILFFAAHDQICSSLLVFTEREIDRSLFGWAVPSSMIMVVNPVIVLLLGTFVARVCQKLKTLRLFYPFLLVASGFGLIALVQLTFPGVVGIIVMISLAELMVGPQVLSVASEVATQKKAGMVMGMVPVSFSLAFLLGGGLSKMIAAGEGYGSGFGKIALIILGGGILLTILTKRLGDGKESPVYR